MSGDSVRFCFPYPVGPFSGPCHYSGPDGIAHQRAHLLKDTQPIGTGPYTSLRSSDAKYLWRPAPGTPFHRPRSTIPGEVGWISWFIVDKDPSTTGHQIYLTDTRRQAEDWYTHRYQTSWLPEPGGKIGDENLGRLLARLYPHAYGPLARTRCTSYDSALHQDCVSRPQTLQTRHWAPPPRSTQTADYPLPEGSWVEEDPVYMQTLSEEVKKKDRSPPKENRNPPESSPSASTHVVPITPVSPSGDPNSARPLSSLSARPTSRSKKHIKSPAPEATPAVGRGVPSQASSSDLNYNRGASTTVFSLGEPAPSASQQLSGEGTYCPAGTGPVLLGPQQRRGSGSSTHSGSWRSLDSVTNRGSSGLLPPAPNVSRASATQGYSSLQPGEPRRLSSAFELRRPEGYRSSVTRSLSFDPTTDR